MKDTYTYKIGESLYLNLTNRCSNRCTFCVRGKETYEGYALWLRGGEPTAEEVLSEIGDPKRFREIVFCGYGEPTYRLDALCKISDAVHAQGGKTRLNTNGHGSAICGRDIVPDLAGRLNGINVSLNMPDAQGYNEVCRSIYKEEGFSILLDFARRAKAAGLNVWFSVVDCIGEEKVAACRKVADGVGIPLRVRPMIS